MENQVLEIPVKHGDTYKVKLPFTKYAHITVVYIIAKGLQDAGLLNNYLELGVSKGSCFNVVAPLAKMAFAVDVDKEFRRNVEHNKNIFWFRGRSSKFLKTTQYKFDLIYIDAHHTFKDGLRDFEAASPRISTNGIIIMHDTYPPSPEFATEEYCGNVHKVATYIRRHLSDQYEAVTLPFYYGLTIIRKNMGKQTIERK